MAKIVLEIPEDVQTAMGLRPEEVEQELRKELALALYQRRILGVGMANRFAGMTRWDFEDLLGARDIIRDYTEEDLLKDLK